MEPSQIQRLFSTGQYQKVLDHLGSGQASSWTDTKKLRCMRAIEHQDTLAFADQLRTMIADRSEPYAMNTSERNNQLRYIALVYAEQNRAKDSCTIMLELCKQSPKVAALRREYAFALSSDSHLDMAESELLRAIKLEPSNASSHAQLGNIYCKTGRVDAGYGSFSRAATLEPDKLIYIQRLLFWSNYLEHTSQQSNYQLSQLWAAKAFPSDDAMAHSDVTRTVDPDRPLKLAFVSADFCAHAISFFIQPLLSGLNRAEFKITCYSDTKKLDHAAEAIRALCDVWRDSSRITDAQLVEHIGRDQIDILVDLSGHAGGNRLGVFAQHAAPLQVSWLGYPSTTGLNSIGYRICDRVTDPSDFNEQFFSEKLLRLPNGFLCYKPLESAPEIKPSGDQSHIRFGSFNNLAKISSLTLDCWAAALLAVPNSTLCIKRKPLIHKNTADYFIQQLAERGISKDRIILKTSNLKIEEHLEQYNHIDIALDTTPYNGTTTTLEALWMGVPVISLIGETHASRVSASILQRLNLGELATKTVFEFADRAKELAELKETLAELRFGLRKRMKDSPLMNNRQFGREFGNTLRSQWRDWCEQRDKQKNDSRAATESKLGAGK